ncbi:MAG: hypothetical protein PHE61_05705 [Candidatus Omnitrophica bacterium]|nr:hypothetical protein [Candidatus Omnitrophota bacterium]
MNIKPAALLAILVILFLQFGFATMREDYVIHVSPEHYNKVWKISQDVVSQYFKIRKADLSSGTIITYERLIEGRGNRTERAVIRLERKTDGILVDVDCPIIFLAGRERLGLSGQFESDALDPGDLDVGREDSVESDFRLEERIFNEIKERAIKKCGATVTPAEP